MSDDLIRRSDAIHELIDIIPYKRYHNGKYMSLLERKECLAAIKAVPARGRQQGKWIFKTIFPNDKSEFPMGYLKCSICGSTHANKIPCNFCDNCGAKMK